MYIIILLLLAKSIGLYGYTFALCMHVFYHHCLRAVSAAPPTDMLARAKWAGLIRPPL